MRCRGVAREVPAAESGGSAQRPPARAAPLSARDCAALLISYCKDVNAAVKPQARALSEAREEGYFQRSSDLRPTRHHRRLQDLL
jgi:hypothetical protein